MDRRLSWPPAVSRIPADARCSSPQEVGVCFPSCRVWAGLVASSDPQNVAELMLPFLGLASTGLGALAFASSWKIAATFKSLDY